MVGGGSSGGRKVWSSMVGGTEGWYVEEVVEYVEYMFCICCSIGIKGTGYMCKGV